VTFTILDALGSSQATLNPVKKPVRHMLEADARAALSFAAPEPWVRQTHFERPKILPADGVHEGAISWLFEEQIRLDADIGWYYRTIDEVVKPQGLDELATIMIDFDPFYERIVFHHARILRQGRVIEHDISERYILMRREKNFESSKLDGQWTVGLSLPDVRLGDIVDVAFTSWGMPSIFKDRFGPSIWMQGHRYHHCRRVRLLCPTSSPMLVKPFMMGCPDPQILRGGEGGYDHYLFEDFAVEPYYWEPNTPDWLRLWRGFYMTNLVHWDEVAQLQRPGYEQGLDFPPELRAVVDEIMAQYPKASDRICVALRYVQENIRYFSVSMGTGGYVPRSLDDIFIDRMGDCKDVSKLLVAMLNAMGIEAWPALVDTRFGLDLINSPPRLWAFDHCIALVVHQGRNYWFDATSLPQHGRLEVMAEADFGYGLPLKPKSELIPMSSGLKASGLGAGRSDIAEPPLIYEVLEHIHLASKPGQMTRIDIDYIFRHTAADYRRYSLSHARLDNFAKDTCELYAELYGVDTLCALPQISDDKTSNQISIRQSFETKQPWMVTGRDSVRLFASPESAFGRLLDAPDARLRFYPYALGPMRRVRHTTRLTTNLPLKLPVIDKLWHFGPLTVSAKAYHEAGVYISTRDYVNTKTYLLPDDKRRLDEASDAIFGFDRLAVLEIDQSVFSWWQGFKVRGLIWALPALLLAFGLGLSLLF
jgi:hypothetical protein